MTKTTTGIDASKTEGKREKEFLIQELERIKGTRDPRLPFVFHSCGKPLNRKTVANAYNRALKKLGITHVSGTHMMRKTSATQANRVTGDFYAVSRLMDHSSPSITLRYVEEVSDQKRKIADALNSVLEETMLKKTDDLCRRRAPIPQYPTKGKPPKLTLIKSVG